MYMRKISFFAISFLLGLVNTVVVASENDNYHFNSSFLLGAKTSTVNLDEVVEGQVLPGFNNVDLYINERFSGNRRLEFARRGKSVQACLPLSLLLEIGVREQALRDARHGLSLDIESSECRTINEWLPLGKADFDARGQRLVLSIPQAQLNQVAHDLVPQSLWQHGENALFSSYNLSYFGVTSANNKSTDSSFLSLRNGLNLGSWQLRNQSSISWFDGGGRWQSDSTYLRRVLPDWRADLTVGDSYTQGRILDGVAYRGAAIFSDERMLPQSQRGYAPVVQGNVSSNSRVVIWQSGRQIYETTVPAGPFKITDLYPASYSGDLVVVITEADGHQYSYNVPFSSVAGSLRPGLARYSATAGQTRFDMQGIGEADFVDWTLEQGISNSLTLNGGMRLSDIDYSSQSFGGVMSSRLGAFGLDVTHSSSQQGGGNKQGWMFRQSFSRTLPWTDTYLSLIGYRYSTAGYTSLRQAMVERKQQQEEFSDRFRRYYGFGQRQRMELTLSQPLGDYGSFFVSGSRTDYHQGGADSQFQLTHQRNFGKINTSLSFSRQFQRDGQADNVIAVSISAPLDFGKKSASLNLSAQQRDGKSSMQSGVNGLLDEEGRWAYSLHGSRAFGKDNWNNSIGTSLDYQSPYARLGAGLSESVDSTQVSALAAGALVVHSGGITLGQYLGDTFALVEAPGAKGAKLGSMSAPTIDSHGFALLPSLTPYAFNRISLDPLGMDENVELLQSSKQAVPYSGAVLKVKFATHQGRALMLRLIQAGGQVVPFGATAVDIDGKEVGLVGQSGLLYLREEKAQAIYQVKWGIESCKALVDFSDKPQKTPILRFDVLCASTGEQNQ
ncbi:MULTISPECIES: fimbria/pilus outer membrane usher protein [Pseudomonas]|uniref:fimbria/pilus outer membrane usher protein n=1 Tax=Pseudomonas TaxID=286 RepID=UPI00236086CB|nr:MULTISPECIES: fimbria/pilus outer membrane usher protein [Pseudomonas]WJV24464.1 fimbria/pilus outer membrane usher protein [Pseudomonas chlororaphis]